MAASKQEIRAWFEKGVNTGKAYMLIVCDTFDYSDYPVYFIERDEAVNYRNNLGNMERLMESYNLQDDQEKQLALTRATCL